jgi:hypothetical protein
MQKSSTAAPLLCTYIPTSGESPALALEFVLDSRAL